MSLRRIFAIIPAAGKSRRMGTPKLLLPWNDSTIIEQVLHAWCSSEVSHAIIVVRQDDVSLANVCAQWPVQIVRPHSDPRDMKESIQFGLRHVAERHQPTSHDQWMVAPADLPALSSDLINQLIHAAEDHSRVMAPRFGGRQGHPVLLPWESSADVFALDDDEGLDRVLAHQEIQFIDYPLEHRVADVDTSEEYRRLMGG